MPDPQLQSIVEKMVAAGEPEDSIRLVIEHFKPPASDVRSRPLLIGGSDAGAAKQFNNPSDPSAMQALNDAKGTMANVGLLSGAAAAGGVASGLPITSMASSAIKGAGKAVVPGAAYWAGKQLGVPSEILNALLVGAGIKGALGGRAPAEKLEPPMARPTPQAMEGPSPQPRAFRIVGPTPKAFRLASETPAAEAPGPTVEKAAAASSIQASPKAFVNLDRPIESGRDWHSGATDAAEKAQATALHKYDMGMDAAYRHATALERAQLAASPPNFRDALIAMLQGGK